MECAVSPARTVQSSENLENYAASRKWKTERSLSLMVGATGQSKYTWRFKDISNCTASRVPLCAEISPRWCTNSSVRYSMAWPRISRACPAWGVMWRRRLLRTLAREATGADIGIEKSVVIESAMVLSSTSSSAPSVFHSDNKGTVSHNRTKAATTKPNLESSDAEHHRGMPNIGIPDSSKAAPNKYAEFSLRGTLFVTIVPDAAWLAITRLGHRIPQ